MILSRNSSDNLTRLFEKIQDKGFYLRGMLDVAQFNALHQSNGFKASYDIFSKKFTFKNASGQITVIQQDNPILKLYLGKGGAKKLFQYFEIRDKVKSH